MNQLDQSLKFTVPLSFEAHSIARQLYRLQSNSQKAKQIYLNTLAVYAVDFYLRCLGVETDVEHSDSRNPLYLKFMNVADLWVKSLGKLECLPILPGAKSCQVPPEVSSERIGYVVVEIERSLKQATILGFTPTAVCELPLSQLRSLAELPEYLNQIQLVPKPASNGKILVNLSQWFDNIFEVGWQEVELSWRSLKVTPAFRTRSNAELFVERVKLFNLVTGLIQQSLELVVKLTRKHENIINVIVEIHPGSNQSYLPESLEVMVLDKNRTAVMQALAGSANTHLQFDFSCESGEYFSIQMKLEETSITEDFML